MISAVCICLIFDKVVSDHFSITQWQGHSKQNQVLSVIWGSTNLESRLITFALGEGDYNYSKTSYGWKGEVKGMKKIKHSPLIIFSCEVNGAFLYHCSNITARKGYNPEHQWL